MAYKASCKYGGKTTVNNYANLAALEKAFGRLDADECADLRAGYSIYVYGGHIRFAVRRA